ncbi:hypothetical protein [Photobacterium leiognathi]|uniref:hypothetical protein n=1 Tax=Photobacterium leiognathi TaxID=553611 RepID=UPI0002088C87|nr:hypothetical protein [Photobacterium leiognathi]PSW52859.1 hypothetical protein CTM83_11630 [Photobacterium leiognathi subsp. mandapamensis]GAA05749.1 putative uncharacterized protein [Photobacterium leiognathi subsp. mandapamensis svers.1.1.]
MKKLFLTTLASLLIVGCTSKPVMNLNNVYVPTAVSGQQHTAEDVQKAILTAAEQRGWSARVIKPGLILANISVRTHSATIEIPYSSTSYSIDYKDSQNLDYDGTDIHRNYNNWVVRLSRSIQQQLGVSTQNY